MNKFKYLKISKNKQLRYLDNNYQEKTYIVFLHGFMSNIEGDKPSAIFKYAKKNNLGFLALEYSGHGKSTGKFTKGNISKWSKEVKISIKKIVKKNKFILVGSSMGAWISLNQFKVFKNQGFDICMLSSHDATPIAEVNKTKSVVYVLGNESDGVSDEISKLCDHRVGIPMNNGVESLNVAVTAALIAFTVC